VNKIFSKRGELFDVSYQPEKVIAPPKKEKIIVIAGPTGVGKTEFSIRLADLIGGEILSSDSMQVYRKMDIGTAKATPQQQQKIPHHLIDIRDVNEPFNVVDFYRESHKVCKDILRRKKVPIVVGGAGFYLHSFLYGPPLGPPADPEIRKYLEEQLEKVGADALYERLQILDPIYAKTITERDRHKIIRALEIMIILKKPVSDLPRPQNMLPTCNFRCWFLYLPREKLYPKVEARCDAMIDAGLIQEVKELEVLGIRNNSSAMQAIGYKQTLDFLQTPQMETDRKTYIDTFKKASRHYVKKQITWFRRERSFRWLDISKIPQDRLLEYVIQDYEQSF
jgi:tRNA dimethylallyltransferase